MANPSSTWKPPADQVETAAASSWKPPADAVITDPTGYKTGFQKFADFLQPVSDMADKITDGLPYVAGAVNPGLGLAYHQMNKINEASGRLGEAVATRAATGGVIPQGVPFVGGKRVPPVPGVAAAGLGMAAAIASNPQSYINPEAGFAGKFAKPVIPAERAFDVATAQKYNLPLTRADLTGSKAAALVETGLSRSITGSGPLQELAKQKLTAVQAAKTKIGQMFGTPEPLSASGIEAKMSMQTEMGGRYKTAVQNYKEVPDVSIRTPNLESHFKQLNLNAVDKGAHATINDIRSRIIGEAPATEETFATPLGATGKSQYRARPVEQPLEIKPMGLKEGDPHALFAYNDEFGIGGTKRSIYNVFGDPQNEIIKKVGHGSSITKEMLDKAGIPITGRQPNVPQGHIPLDNLTAPRVQSFQQLNDIRNILSKEIQGDTTYNPLLGNQMGPKANALVPFKKALDADIQDYVKSNQSTPYGKLESGEFNEKFGKANKYYGEYKKLRNDKLTQKISRVRESDIPKTVFGPGRIEDVKIAKQSLGKSGFEAAKKQFFNDLLEEKNIEGKLAKYEPEFLNEVFSPQELNSLKEAASLKKTSLTAEQLAGNPSGTAQVLSTLATGGALGHALTKAITNPLLAAGEAAVALGGPYLGTKAYLGTTGGVPASFGRGSIRGTAAARSADLPVNAERRKSFMSEYVRRIAGGRSE